MHAIRARGLVFIVLVAGIVVAGCTSEAPTEGSGAAGRPSFDTGVGFGSGNFSDDSTTVQSTEAADSTESTAEERTGVGFGSGN